MAQEAYEEPTGLNTTLTFVAKITKVVPPTFSDPSSFKTTLVKRASSEVPPAPTQSEPVASSTTLSVAPSIPTNATADGEVLPVKSEFLTQVFANLSCDLDGNINYLRMSKLNLSSTPANTWLLVNIPYLSLPFKSHKEKQEITDKVNATFEDIAAHLNKVADVISKATPEQLNLTTVTPEERIPLTAVAKAQSQGAIQTIDDLLGLLTAVPTAVGVAVTIPVAIVTLVPLLVPAAGLFFIIGPLAILLLGVIISVYYQSVTVYCIRAEELKRECC